MYRQWQKDLARFEQLIPTNRHLGTLDPEYFSFLWYVYNRGGICNISTFELWFERASRTNYYRLNKLIEGGWIQPLKCVYRRKAWLGRKRILYRVSTRFLNCVGNPHANIRKIRDAKKAISFVGIANFFLMPGQSDYQIVNRRARADFLVKRFQMDEDLFPKYFVYGEEEKAITSLNHEIVCKDGGVFVVWYPHDRYGSGFKDFFEKWHQVFAASEQINCLGISTTEPNQAMLMRLVTKIEKSEPKTKLDVYKEARAETRGEVHEVKSEDDTIPFQLMTAHYVDVWQDYNPIRGQT